MAVVGLVVIPLPGQEDAAARALASFPGVVEQRQADGGRLVAVLECSSRDIRDRLEEAAALEPVLELAVAYADYEDDLDDEGHMPCPPPRRKRRAGA